MSLPLSRRNLRKSKNEQKKLRDELESLIEAAGKDAGIYDKLPYWNARAVYGLVSEKVPTRKAYAKACVLQTISNSSVKRLKRFFRELHGPKLVAFEELIFTRLIEYECLVPETTQSLQGDDRKKAEVKKRISIDGVMALPKFLKEQSFSLSWIDYLDRDRGDKFLYLVIDQIKKRGFSYDDFDCRLRNIRQIIDENTVRESAGFIFRTLLIKPDHELMDKLLSDRDRVELDHCFDIYLGRPELLTVDAVSRARDLLHCILTILGPICLDNNCGIYRKIATACRYEEKYKFPDRSDLADEITKAVDLPKDLALLTLDYHWSTYVIDSFK
jgi:hypothetical protein